MSNASQIDPFQREIQKRVINNFGEIASTALASFEPPKRGFAGSLVTRARERILSYEVGHVLKSVQERAGIKPRVQATVISGLEAFGYASPEMNIMDRMGLSFKFISNLCAACEATTACIETRVLQANRFTKPAIETRGRATEPSFKIVMNNDKETPTAEDVKLMDEATQFIMNTGFTDPPLEQRSVGWEPGFTAFTSNLLRDSLRYDWCAVRSWESADAPDKEPVVSFAAMDASSIRRVQQPKKVQDGKPTFTPMQNPRTDTRDPITFMSLDYGGSIFEEFTSREIGVGIRNPRTDELFAAYGYSEAEMAFDMINGWLFAREFNISRFKSDRLPRGAMVINGNITQEMFTDFRLKWAQALRGPAKHWSIPVLRGPQGNAKLEWIPFDLAPKDMEWHQFMYVMGIVIHALYHISPAETGWENASPFKGGVINNEPSPIDKILASQDLGLHAILDWYAEFMNRKVLWRVPRFTKYKLKFCGTEDYDAMADEQLAAQMLANGTITPRMLWDLRDQPITGPFKDHEAWDLPAPLLQGMQYLDGKQMQEDQMKQQQEAQSQQMAFDQHMQQSQMMLGQGSPKNIKDQANKPKPQQLPDHGSIYGSGEKDYEPGGEEVKKSLDGMAFLC